MLENQVSFMGYLQMSLDPQMISVLKSIFPNESTAIIIFSHCMYCFSNLEYFYSYALVIASIDLHRPDEIMKKSRGFSYSKPYDSRLVNVLLYIFVYGPILLQHCSVWNPDSYPISPKIPMGKNLYWIIK